MTDNPENGRAIECAGKQRLTPEAAARIVARARAKGVYLDRYRCRYCGGLHVGTAPRRRRRKRTRP